MKEISFEQVAVGDSVLINGGSSVHEVIAVAKEGRNVLHIKIKHGASGHERRVDNVPKNHLYKVLVQG